MKGKSRSHRYRPASEYDDATLAQKREYWRNKKREQRARRSERAGVLRRDSCENANDVPVANSLSTQKEDSTYKTGTVYPVSQKEIKVEDLTVEAVERQNEKWPQFENSPQVPSSCFISATVSASARVPESGTFASLTANRTQLHNSSLVPAVRNGRIRNGSSSKIKPCVSMQHTSVTKSQKAQDAYQPKQTVMSCTTLNFPQRGSIPVTTRGKMAPQIGTKSMMGHNQRSRCVVNSQTLPESEEEKAARRREHWRIKKREQRAKLAARLGKTTGRMHSTDVKLGGRAGQNSTLTENRLPSHLPSKSFFNGTGQKQWNRIKTVPKKWENPKPQIGCSFGQQIGRSVTHTALSSFSRGIARCKTPRHRFIEAQKIVNQRNARGKLSLVSGFGSRNIPKIDPNDTVEQIIAKRREYWRIKKREQRAKMSMEVKARMAERDSFMRRVKRYQSILEEIRRSRNISHIAISESPLIPASETIGGFIKEDGTMTFNISQSSELLREEKQCGISKTPNQLPPEAKWRTSMSISDKPASCSLRLPRVKISVPLSGALVAKPSALLSIKPVDPIKSTSIQTAGKPSLTHSQSMHNSPVAGPTAESNLGGCVKKMAVSSSVPFISRALFDPHLTEEERMAKKREYWRVKKREQRAARAARLKLGVFHARVNSAIQRRKASRQVAVNTGLLNRTDRTETAESNARKVPVNLPTDAIKQETEIVPADNINPCSDQVIHSHMESSSSALPAVETPEVNPVVTAESQITTLQAVASMKKLLEETLSTVTDSQTVQIEIKTETSEETLEEDTKPKLSELIHTQDSLREMTSDLKLHIKTDADEPEVSFSPLREDLSQKTPPPLLSDEVLPSTCDQHAQTSPNVIVSLCKVEAVEDPPSHTRNLRPRIAQHVQPSQQTMSRQQLSQLKLCKQQKGQNWAMQKFSLKQSGRTSLQEKREYWKLMKRQQRARLRARQREGQIYGQDPALEVFDYSGDDPLLKPCNDEWTSKSPNMDSALPLPTLTPPDNPLSSMNLHPIEPLCPSPISGFSPVKLPQSPENFSPLPTDIAPLNNLVPPKRIPGESEEDFLKRKREYWRIKKKEQRARKANQAVTARTTSNMWRPIPPAHDMLTQRALGVTSEQAEKDSQQLTSESLDAAQGSFTFSDNTAAAAQSESDHHEDEDFISVALWRNCYLMDYDPLNQLLVCMVCGELQYSHSLEGVKAHIDQAHPQTMELEVLDRQRLLDAWDKQLSQRERFFSSQLQQKSEAVTDADSN